MTRRDFLCLVSAAGAFYGRAPSRAEWARQRERILANLQLVMGPQPSRRDVPLDTEELEASDLPAFRRSKITFLGADGDRVPAYLLVPNRLGKRAPAMLCLHQTVRVGKDEPAGISGNPNLHYAQELAERGYVTLAPDYPNFGDYRFDPYQHGYASATMKAISNHMRAVDLLRSLPQVAPDRIGSLGHSLGGHNTLFVGVFEERIRVLASSCGFTSFKKYYGGDLTGWSHKGYMPWIAEKFGKDPARMPFDFSDVLAALAPRPVFISAPVRDSNFEVSGVKDCVEAASFVYEKIFHAPRRLQAIYPETRHEFAPAARQAAYQFLDRWLA